MDTSARKKLLDSADTIVVKVGSRVLADSEGRLDEARVSSLADQLTQLADSDRHVVLVSSGAVAAGIGKLGLTSRPTDVAHLQAVASVGQAHVIQAYEKYFSQHGRHAAQVLLIADDLDDRTRYLNVRNTIVALLELGVIPIINENDSVSVDELLTTFGDNDRLAAIVAGLFARPVLVILSDVEGVYDRNPEHPDSQLIPVISVVDQALLDSTSVSMTSGPVPGTATSKAAVGKGGMQSKLRAAQFVARSGAPVVIAGGRVENVLPRVINGEPLGTLFPPQSTGLTPRKRWIGFTVQAAGTIVVDPGAAKALRSGGPSLLAIGIRDVRGQFSKGEVVSVCDGSGAEFARGLSNYDSHELLKIKGLRSPSIAKVLGHCPYEEVIHRDNMALVEVPASS